MILELTSLSRWPDRPVRSRADLDAAVAVQALEFPRRFERNVIDVPERPLSTVDHQVKAFIFAQDAAFPARTVA